jgi:hypothetical protein
VTPEKPFGVRCIVAKLAGVIVHPSILLQ